MLQEEHVASVDNLRCYLVVYSSKLQVFLHENGGRSTIQDAERK